MRRVAQYAPVGVKQWACGWIAPGHHYTLEILRNEGEGFVVDPLTACTSCAKPLPEQVYLKAIREYQAIVEVHEDQEDEVW